MLAADAWNACLSLADLLRVELGILFGLLLVHLLAVSAADGRQPLWLIVRIDVVMKHLGLLGSHLLRVGVSDLRTRWGHVVLIRLFNDGDKLLFFLGRVEL